MFDIPQLHRNNLFYHLYITPVVFQCLCIIHSDFTSLHTHTAQTQRCVYQTCSQPFDHTWPCSKLPSYAEANNTSHVQVSINRSFDGGCWEFQGGGVHAGIPGVSTGGGGGVWSSLGLEGEKWRSWWCGGDFSGECFYRSRRVTTLEPQDTLAAVSGEAKKVLLVGVTERVRG